MTSAIPFHPLADIFPMLDPKEQMSLSDDIKAHGLREPIVMHEGMILDGRNRYQACVMAGVDPTQKDFDGPDPLAFVISANLHRRHLNDDQRAMVADNIATLERGDNQHTANAGTSRAKAAALLNVSEAKVERVHKVRAKGAPELVAAVEKGEVSVSAGASVAGLPVDDQKEIVAAGPAAVRAAAKGWQHRPAPKKTPEQIEKERLSRERADARWAKRQAKEKLEREAKETAATEAANLILEHMPDQLGTLVDLINKADFWAFLVTLRELSASRRFLSVEGRRNAP